MGCQLESWGAGRGCQSIIWPKIPKNCMNRRKFDRGRDARPKFCYIDQPLIEI